jgi:hypothetical protein
LSIVVNVVSISACLYKSLHNIEETFSGSIEQWRLTITVHLVSIASVVNEYLSKLIDAIPCHVEKTSLIKRVKPTGVTLSNFNQVFGHFNRLLIILDLNGSKQRVLVVLVLNEQRNIVWLHEAK